MEIKRVLKELDVGISRLAKELKISRPTLDTYIECYENSKPIPNSTYQEIFDYLFVTDNLTQIEFAKKFDHVKREILQNYKNDANESREQKIRNKVSDYVYDENADGCLLEFINMFISNSKNDLVKSIYSYFNYVNGLKKLDEQNETDKNKAIYSNLYKIFSSYNDDSIQIDNESYNKFVEKSNRIYKKKDVVPSDEQLLKYIKDSVDAGFDIDMDYVKQLLGKKES